MKTTSLLFTLTGIILLSACSIHFYRSQSQINFYEKVSATRDKNVCKHLKDSVVLYAIFVDVDHFHPWTKFDVESTLDSILKASNWLEKTADSLGRDISIKVVNHEQGSKYSFPEHRAHVSFLNYKRVKSTKRRHQNQMDHWMDQISKYAGRAAPKRTSSKVGTRLKITDTERLIASLRDYYETDNIALMIFVNGYYEDFPSLTFNTETDVRVEYSLMTNKNPAIIAHEFLHLFGALDLYPNQNFPWFNYAEIQEKYPNEIMRIQHKSIEKLSLSPITKYYIGWQDTLSWSDTRLLYHLNKVVEY